MKISGLKFWSILVLSLSLFGCKEENEFFETVDKVRLISYPTRTSWNKNERFDYYDKKEIVVPKDKIVDDIILDNKIIDEIEIILQDDLKESCNVAACYEPRHMLQFYKKDKLLGYVELCLECGAIRTSKKLNFLPAICIQNGEKLKEIFKKLGLKNYGEESPILKILEKY